MKAMRETRFNELCSVWVTGVEMKMEKESTPREAKGIQLNSFIQSNKVAGWRGSRETTQ